jgi:hypothetical protein
MNEQAQTELKKFLTEDFLTQSQLEPIMPEVKILMTLYYQKQ